MGVDLFGIIKTMKIIKKYEDRLSIFQLYVFLILILI
jgi:hypothetical protein